MFSTPRTNKNKDWTILVKGTFKCHMWTNDYDQPINSYQCVTNNYC